ncbi:unnamed protein product [Chironomus riparius]|uniref:Chitin-binding type-2 domain-containing protein n=1 Tax=Chironomus riparius TaxID=315576 RepID=A0A9P0IMF8_9DIPT|nr:unnamed protein product [Chironomus riparius]
MFRIAAAVVAFAIINLANFVECINFICNNTDEFYYTMPQTNCAMYYRCREGHKINYECPLGMMFDFYRQKCISNTNVCFESTCHEKFDNSYYPDTTQSCHRFFRCQNGKILSYENCKSGYLFNGTQCQYAETVKCDVPNSMLYNNQKTALKTKRSCDLHSYDECRFLSDGFYADESSKNCKSYIKCLNGKTAHLKCPSSSVFDPIEGNCVPDTIYECPKSSRLERLCKGKADGVHPDPRFSCNAYVKCYRGAPIQFEECLLGQVFDNHRKQCVYKSTSLCIHETRSSDCMHLEMGYYQDRSLESSCKNYFFCYNGRKTTFSCSNNELFNGESCVEERQYTCPNLDEDSCDTKEDGYYKDNNLDCRSYFYCSSNRKYSFLCKDGQAFDGNRCVSKRHVDICVKKNSDCSGKSDGYYQDVKSGCSKYFYCKQSEKLQVITCRNGRIFNGHSCVSPQSYACPNVGYNLALKLNCVQRKCTQCPHDGFFADYDSRCKNYHFCVNGSATKLSCLKNFIFNENEGLCVPQDKYQCPVYCSGECS